MPPGYTLSNWHSLRINPKLTSTLFKSISLKNPFHVAFFLFNVVGADLMALSVRSSGLVRCFWSKTFLNISMHMRQ